MAGLPPILMALTGWSWSKISGPSSFTIATPAAVQTTVSNLVVGIYKFELKVTDNGEGIDGNKSGTSH